MFHSIFLCEVYSWNPHFSFSRKIKKMALKSGVWKTLGVKIVGTKVTVSVPCCLSLNGGEISDLLIYLLSCLFSMEIMAVKLSLLE